MNKPYVPREYWENRFSTSGLNLNAVGYSKLGLVYNTWLYRLRLLVLDRALRRINLSAINSNLLDIGVGSGAYIDFWQKKGIRNLTGIDITEISINILKDKYPAYCFLKSDIASNEIEQIDGQYEIITAFDILFHIVDDAGFHTAISNISKLVKDGGWVIISDTFCDHPWGPIFHEYHRSIKNYQSEIEQQHLVIKHIEPIFFTMLTPLCGSKLMLWLNTIRNRSIAKLNSRSYTRWLINFLAIPLFSVDLILGQLFHRGPSLKFLIAQKDLSIQGDR